MAVTRPTAEQLDIQSIAAAIAGDSVAIGSISTQLTTDGNINITESQISDFDDYVNFTSAQSISGNKTYTGTLSTFTQDVIIQGNTTIQGTLTTQSSNDVNIGDSLITLQSELTGAPALNAGIQIERGTSTNAQILWDEATDTWNAGVVGALQPIVLDDDSRLTDARAPTAHNHDSVYATTAQGVLATSAFQHSDATSTLTNNDAFADLTTAQTIAGAKTFSANARFNGAVYTDTLGADDSAFIFTTQPIRYSSAVVAAGFTPTEAIPKSYADDNFVDLTTDQTIAGLKSFSAAIGITSFVANNGTHTFTTAPIQYSTTVRDSAFTEAQIPSRKYIDNNFLSLAGGTVTGALTIDYATPIFVIKATGSTESANQQFKDNLNVIQADMYLEGAASKRLFIRNRTGGTVHSQLVMDAGFINCSVPVLASAPTAANHLTTRTYVEDNFVDKTTAQTITGEKTLSSNLFVTKATATISLKAVGNTVPTFNMFQDANAVMQMFYIGNKVNATTDHIRWVLNANTGAENTFRLYHNRATFVNEVQGVAATSSTGFVTLAQVQALIAAEHP